MSDVQIALSVGLAAMRVTKKHSVLLFMSSVKAKWRLLCGTPAIKMIISTERGAENKSKEKTEIEYHKMFGREYLKLLQ